MNLPFGLGISVVDKTPQEIVYLSLQGMVIEYILSDQKQILKVDVKSLQVVDRFKFLVLGGGGGGKFGL